MKPMLARPAEVRQLTELATSEDWIMSPKADGERLLVEIVNEKIWYRNRSGVASNAAVPGGVKHALSQLAAPGITLTLDGELVGGVFLVFDVLTPDGFPLFDRLMYLDALFDSGVLSHQYVRKLPWAQTVDSKAEMMAWTIAGAGEGVVVKRADSAYQPGVRSRDWLKVKRYHDVDCVVEWVDSPESGGKWNMGLSMFRDGVLVNVGECTRLAGDGVAIEAGQVVAVQCLYSTDDDRLYQPTRPRIRTDKDPYECTIDQLDGVRTNKNLLLEMT